MKNKHAIIELPANKTGFEEILQDESHDIQHVAFSSTHILDEVKHYVLVIWHDHEYGDHLF